MISIPISTLQQMKKGSDTVSTVYIAYDEKLNPEQALAYSDQLKKELKARKKVSPDDENAVVVRNRAEGLKKFFPIFICHYHDCGIHWSRNFIGRNYWD